MKILLSLTAAAVLSLNPALVSAGDVSAGKAKSATCAACHGANGISSNDIWPNLAGQKQGYLVAQLKAFRSGKRSDPMMGPMVATLSDTDIDNLAAYFSSLGQ